jgi:hypothetical protein
MNRFTDEAAGKATDGVSAATATGKRSPREDAEERLYTDEEGGIIMPQPNLYNSLICAGKFFKVGKKQISTQRASLVPAGIFMLEPYYPLISNGDWSVDTRPVRIPATGGRILRHRPIFHDWRVTFELEVDEEMFAPKLVRELVDASGSKIGLCDYRPDCRGPFGRFRVDAWKIIND